MCPENIPSPARYFVNVSSAFGSCLYKCSNERCQIHGGKRGRQVKVTLLEVFFSDNWYENMCIAPMCIMYIVRNHFLHVNMQKKLSKQWCRNLQNWRLFGSGEVEKSLSKRTRFPSKPICVFLGDLRTGPNDLI